MRKSLLIILAFLMLFALHGQNLGSFSNVDFKNLSENKLELILNQAKASGYSESQLLALAKQQGLSISELESLNQRISSIKSKRFASGSASPVSDSRLRAAYADSIQSLRTKEGDIFGLNIFRGSSFLSFQPNLNISIPRIMF